MQHGEGHLGSIVQAELLATQHVCCSRVHKRAAGRNDAFLKAQRVSKLSVSQRRHKSFAQASLWPQWLYS